MVCSIAGIVYADVYVDINLRWWNGEQVSFHYLFIFLFVLFDF